MRKLFLLFGFIFSFAFSQEIFCGNDMCHPVGGKCVDNKCICQGGYISANLSTFHTSCNYKQKSKLKAGLIEMFLGCGIGHFYAGRSFFGTIKLVFYSLFCSCCCYSLYIIRKIRREEEAEDHPYASLLFFCSMAYLGLLVLWQILDGFLFWFGIYSDGKGVNMY
jgi:hypothetical protein